MQIYEETKRKIEALHAHPLVKVLFNLMNEEGMSAYALCKKTGIDKSVLSRWRTRNSPTLITIEACFNALGYELVIQKIKEEK